MDEMTQEQVDEYLAILAEDSTRNVKRELEAVRDPGFDGHPQYKAMVEDEARTRGLL